MPHSSKISPSRALRSVRYEIRGRLARRALELERQGYEILSLNIGNPGMFGFRTPETMRLAMIENLGSSEAYCGQKGIFPAREAVVMRPAKPRCHGHDRRGGVHRQRRQRTHRPDAQGFAQSRRRGADSQSRTIRCGPPQPCSTAERRSITPARNKTAMRRTPTKWRSWSLPEPGRSSSSIPTILPALYTAGNA